MGLRASFLGPKRIEAIHAEDFSRFAAGPRVRFHAGALFHAGAFGHHLARGAASRRAREGRAAITNQTVATVTNPAGNATTSIVITGSTVTGAVTNAGTITPGKPGGLSGFATAGDIRDEQHDRRWHCQYGHDQREWRTVMSPPSIFVNGSTVAGGITNAGTISAGQGSFGEGIFVIGSTISGGIANTGMITVSGGESIRHCRSE